MFRTLNTAALVCASFFLLAGGAAQAYPDHPIRLIRQFAQGGGSDSVARPRASELEKILGQNIIIDSKPGANGVIANQYVSTAPA